MANQPQAFLFDLNGTMIDDMHFHTQAWHQMLNQDLAYPLGYEEVKKHMYGKNSEVLARIFGSGHFPEERVEEISVEKERRYQQAYFPHLALIHGLDALLENAHSQGIRMAIGSAAIPFNIDFVLDNLHIRHYFGAIVSAHDVQESKPHPETFLQAARLLGVEPGRCVVFEDAPKGVEAAQKAGMGCVVITTMHEPDEFQNYRNVIGFISDYTDPLLRDLLAID